MGPEQEDYIETVLTCEGDFYDPAFHKQLHQFSERLQELLVTGKNDLILKKVEPWNSVRVTFNIPKEAAQRLKQLAERGDHTLRQLGILAVQIEGDKVISLTIAGKNNETTELVFRTAGSTVPSQHGGANTPGSVFDMSSSDEMNLPGPSNVEATRKNIAEYLSQQGTIGASLFGAVINQPGPSLEVNKLPNVVVTQCEPIPFRPSSQGPFGIPVSSSPSHSPGNQQLLLPPGRSPPPYPSPTHTTSQLVPQQQSYGTGGMGIPGTFSVHGQLSPKLSSSSPGPHFPSSASAMMTMPAGGAMSLGNVQPPVNFPVQFNHPVPTLNNMQRMAGNKNLTRSSPLLVNLLQSHSEAAGHFNNLMFNRMPPPMDTSPKPPKRRRKPRKPKDKGQGLPQQVDVNTGLISPGISGEAETPGHPMGLNIGVLEEQRVPAIPGVPLPPSVSVAPNSTGAAGRPMLQGRSPSMNPELQVSMDHIINPYTGQMEPIDKALESPSKHSEARSASHSPAQNSEDYYGKQTLANPVAMAGSLSSPRGDSLPNSDSRPRTPKNGGMHNAPTSTRVPQLHNDTSEIIPHSTPDGTRIAPNSPRDMSAATAAGATGTLGAVSIATAQDILNSIASAKMVEMGLGNSAVLISNTLLHQTENNDVKTHPLFQPTNPLLAQGVNPLLQDGPVGHLFQQGNLNPMLHGDLVVNSQNRNVISVSTSKNDSDNKSGDSNNPTSNSQILAGTVVPSNASDIVFANPILHTMTVNPFQVQCGSNPPRQGEVNDFMNPLMQFRTCSTAPPTSMMGSFPILSQMNVLSSQQERNVLPGNAGVNRDDINSISSGNSNAVKSTEKLVYSSSAKPVNTRATPHVSLGRTGGPISHSESKGPSELGPNTIRSEHQSVCYSTTFNSVTPSPTTSTIHVNTNTHESALSKDSNNAKISSLTNALHTNVSNTSPILTNSIHENFNHDSDNSSTQSCEGLASVAANVSDVKENHKDALMPHDSDKSKGENSSAGDQIARTALDRETVTVGMALEEKINTDAIMADINDKLLNPKNTKLNVNYLQKAAMQHAQFGLYHHKMGVTFPESSEEKSLIATSPMQLKSAAMMVTHCDNKLDLNPVSVDANPQMDRSKLDLEHVDLTPSERSSQLHHHAEPVNGDAFSSKLHDHFMFKNKGNVPLNCSVMTGNLPLSISDATVNSKMDVPVSTAGSLSSSLSSSSVHGVEFYNNLSDLNTTTALASLRESSLQTSHNAVSAVSAPNPASYVHGVPSSGSTEKQSMLNEAKITSHTPQTNSAKPAPTMVDSDSNCQQEVQDRSSNSQTSLPQIMDYNTSSADQSQLANFNSGGSTVSCTAVTSRVDKLFHVSSSSGHPYSSQTFLNCSVADSHLALGTSPRTVDVTESNILSNSVDDLDKQNPHVSRAGGRFLTHASMAESSNIGMSTSTCGLTVPGQGEPLSTLATIASTTCVVQSKFSSLSSSSLTDLPSAAALDMMPGKNVKQQLNERDVCDAMMDVEMADMLEKKVTHSPKRSNKNYTVSKLLDESKKERARAAGLLAGGGSPRGAFLKTVKAANAVDVNLTPRNANLHLNFVNKSLSTPPLLNSTPHPITAPCFPLNLTESVQKIMKAIPSGDGLLPQLPSVKPLTSKSSPRSSPCAKTNLSLSPPQNKWKMMQTSGTVMPVVDTELTNTSMPNTGTCPQPQHLTSLPPSTVTPPADQQGYYVSASSNTPEQVSNVGDMSEKHCTGVHNVSSCTQAGEAVMTDSSAMVSSAGDVTTPAVNAQECITTKSSLTSPPGNHSYAASPSQDPLNSVPAVDTAQQTTVQNSHTESVTPFPPLPPLPPHTPTPPPTPLSPPPPPSELSCEPSVTMESTDVETHNASNAEPICTLAQHSTSADICQPSDEIDSCAAAEQNCSFSTREAESGDSQNTATPPSSSSSEQLFTAQSAADPQQSATPPTVCQDAVLSSSSPDVTSQVSESASAQQLPIQVSESSSHVQQPASQSSLSSPQQPSQLSQSSSHNEQLLSQDSQSSTDTLQQPQEAAHIQQQSDQHQTSQSSGSENREEVSGAQLDQAEAAVHESNQSVIAGQTNQPSSVPHPDSSIAPSSDTSLVSEGTTGPPAATDNACQGTTASDASTDQGSQETTLPPVSTAQVSQVDSENVTTSDDQNQPSSSPPAAENVNLASDVTPPPQETGQDEGKAAQVTTAPSSGHQEKVPVMTTYGGAPLSPAVINAECAPAQPITPEVNTDEAKLVRQKSTEECGTLNSAHISRRSSRGSTESVTSTGSKDENMTKMDEVGCNGPRTRRKTLSESSERAESPVFKIHRTESPTPRGKRTSSGGKKRGSSDDQALTDGADEQTPAEEEPAEAAKAHKQTGKPPRGSKRKLAVPDDETHKMANASTEVGSKKLKVDGSTALEAESQTAVAPVSKPMDYGEEDEQKLKGKAPPKIVADDLKVATTKTAQTPEDNTSPKGTETGRRGVSTRPKKPSDSEVVENREVNAETIGGGRRGKAKQVTEDGVDVAKNGGKKINAEMVKTEASPEVDDVKRGQGRRNAERTGRRSPTVVEDKSPGRLIRARGKMSPPKETKTLAVEKREEGGDSVYKRATRSTKPKDHLELPPPASKRRRASRDHR